MRASGRGGVRLLCSARFGEDATMPLVHQILTICAVSLSVGLALLGVRGVPLAPKTEAEQGMCSAPPSLAAEQTRWISTEEAHRLFTSAAAVFVDCRPRSEFLQGHIASALSLPSDSSEIDASLLAQLSPAQTVIAYCNAAGGCASSVRLAARLTDLGLSDVRILTGGLPGWLELGYPAESGACRLCPNESSP